MEFHIRIRFIMASDDVGACLSSNWKKTRRDKQINIFIWASCHVRMKSFVFETYWSNRTEFVCTLDLIECLIKEFLLFNGRYWLQSTTTTIIDKRSLSADQTFVFSLHKSSSSTTFTCSPQWTSIITNCMFSNTSTTSSNNVDRRISHNDNDDNIIIIISLVSFIDHDDKWFRWFSISWWNTRHDTNNFQCDNRQRLQRKQSTTILWKLWSFFR